MNVTHQFVSLNVTQDSVWRIKIFIITASIISLLISSLLLHFFSHSVYYAFIWNINIVFVTLIFILSAIVMKEYGLVGFCVLLLAFYSVGMLIWLRKKINLVSRMFAESAKALYDVKTLWLMPLIVSMICHMELLY